MCFTHWFAIKLKSPMPKVKNKQAEFTKWMGPVIEALKELGGSGKPREVSNFIAKNHKLSNAVLDQTTKSGEGKFHNQVQWARQYLVWEGFIDSSKRGIWSLTRKGSSAKVSPEEGRKIFLKWVDIFQKARKNKNQKELITEQQDFEPGEIEVVKETDLLGLLQKLSPKGFEQVCGRLLRESDFEDVTITGRSHDGGIDGHGTLEINPFVTMKVLFQFKRYIGTVSRAQVGDFRNAMLGRAEKGIIITTGTFSQDARKEADREGAPKIELVDGEKLVEMFKRVELGMKQKTIYEVDLNFFQEYM
jgi:restriction system protein